MQTRAMDICVRIGTAPEGRIYEGIGGITSNGMSKLLMDYPQERRDEIMNLLFKPNCGASLQHLKVEIGSDVNTSCGTEPSHMRSRDDFDISRGYGLPIAKLAKAVHPELLLDALRWGTPRWIGSDADKGEYYLNFLKGAREAYGLEFDYLGPDINEGAFSRDWTVNTLKPLLDRNGFSHIKLVADDSDHGWDIADHAAADPELFAAVHAYAVHYRQDSTDTAKESGKPLWLSEDLAPFRHSFVGGALHVARRIIDMYVTGRMVKYEIHPLVEAEYGNTPFNYKGILVASWPWSGHYRIDAGLWVIAQFTQFMKPGWRYVDDGCGRTESGGHVTLTDERTGDVSIVVVNAGPSPLSYSFELGRLLPQGGLHVWRTTEHEHFRKDDDLAEADSEGTIRINVAPYSVCTLTSTTGQRKGDEELTIPGNTRFELPYLDDFSSGRIGASPLYTSDQGGAFEFDKAEAGEGVVVRQQLTEKEIPVDWTYRLTPEPYTLLGSLEWTDYRLSAEVRLESEQGYAGIGGRVNHTDKSSDPPAGYLFIARTDGSCELRKGSVPLARGRLPEPPGFGWHRMELSFSGSRITASWGGEALMSATDSELPSGQAALLSGYHRTAYRKLRIDPIDARSPSHCIRYDDTHPAIQYGGEWTRADGDYNLFARTLTKSGYAGAVMTFRFAGTGVSLIGAKKPDGGMADIYLDGVYRGTADTFRATPGYRKALFAARDLDPAIEHELKIVVRGLKHPDAEGTFIHVDAIEVTEALA